MASILDTPSTAERFEGRSMLSKLVKDYQKYKRNYAENIKFQATAANLSIILGCWWFSWTISPAAIALDYAPLQLVQIYFDTATFDEIERDVKVTLEAQLGLIGGTMGLLTGFSILSGVEIIYFTIKLLISMRVTGAGLALKQRKNATS